MNIVLGITGGIAEAFLIGRDFLAGGSCALILGDNIFYGDNLRALLRTSAQQSRGATVFACWVDDPERYGVIEFDPSHRPLRMVGQTVFAQSSTHCVVLSTATTYWVIFYR